MTINLRTIGPEPEGATPLGEEELAGLLPDFVATRADLKQVEYENIAKALPWALRQARLRGPAGLLQYHLIFALHRRMFADVWRWAGGQRKRMTNIGVDVSQIPEQVKRALDDAMYWHDHAIFSVDRRAAQLHHRLVTAHPFPNGNGRCTRLMADLYLISTGAEPFSWSGNRLEEGGGVRETYIESLLAADNGDCASLIAFARS